MLTGAYAFGHISGGHFNPAVSFGLWAGRRFPASDLVTYIIAQVAGAIVAPAILYLIASGKEGFSLTGGLASNGYGSLSPGKYALHACFVAEVVLTFMFCKRSRT
jgi:aquaporin Z